MKVVHKKPIVECVNRIHRYSRVDRQLIWRARRLETSHRSILRGVPVLISTTYENEDSETVHANAGVMVEPGTIGLVLAFVDELLTPFN